MSQTSNNTLLQFVELRNILDGVSQTSWAFATINKANPLERLTDEEAIKIIDAYKGLIVKLKKALDEVKI
jgi:hypothetical protein